MNSKELLTDIRKKLLAKGADKVSLTFNAETDEEFNIIYKELNLMRTVETNSIGMGVIKDQKQASTRLNQFDAISIDKAVEDLMMAVENSNPDPAFDISPLDEGSWTDGDMQPDVDKVIMRLTQFISQMGQRYPDVHFDGGLTHEKAFRAYMNSNGTYFEHQEGAYSFNTIFTAKKGSKMSSMNYTGFALADLDKEFMDINFTEEFIRQNTEQTETFSVPENFSGDVIVAPFLAMELIETFVQSQIGDSGLLMKSSKYSDHLGQKIMDDKISIFNDPLHPELCSRGRYSSDGFKSGSGALIENGILRHYPISLFTANKCGKQRTIGPCSNLIVPAGNVALADMIKSVKEGVLCMRASFGRPNANGDFSGVMKNSYYIKDGKVAFPISETMINGNILDMLNNVEALSSESFNTGSSIFPYMQIRDVYITKK